MLNFVTHDFDGLPVSQASEDTKIGKVFVPKGYVNLTLLCKAGGKRLGNWTRLDSTQAYLNALASNLQIPIKHDSDIIPDTCQAGISKTPLIIIAKGGKSELQGSFGHIQVAQELARWIKRSCRQSGYGRQCLYLIADKKSGLVKIGISIDVTERLSSLQSHCQNPLELLGHSEPLRDAKRAEWILHSRLADFNVFGEWFDLVCAQFIDLKSLPEIC